MKCLSQWEKNLHWFMQHSQRKCPGCVFLYTSFKNVSNLTYCGSFLWLCCTNQINSFPIESGVSRHKFRVPTCPYLVKLFFSHFLGLPKISRWFLNDKFLKNWFFKVWTLLYTYKGIKICISHNKIPNFVFYDTP